MCVISLSFKAITDEMMALTALRNVASSNPGSGMLLCADQLDGLRVMVRMVFAETVLALGGCVESSRIDDADTFPSSPFSTDNPPTLELTLRSGFDFPAGTLLTIKRHMEHIVAAGVLAWIATDADGEFAEQLTLQKRAAQAELAATLASAQTSRTFSSESAKHRPGWV